jgi:hypothetical protein
MYPATVEELSWSQMYNRFNCNPMHLDLRIASVFGEGHLYNCARIDLHADDEESGAAMHEQIMQKYQRLDKRNRIVLSSQADWEAHDARILQALAFSPRFPTGLSAITAVTASQPRSRLLPS